MKYYTDCLMDKDYSEIVREEKEKMDTKVIKAKKEKKTKIEKKTKKEKKSKKAKKRRRHDSISESDSPEKRQRHDSEHDSDSDSVDSDTAEFEKQEIGGIDDREDRKGIDETSRNEYDAEVVTVAANKSKLTFFQELLLKEGKAQPIGTFHSTGKKQKTEAEQASNSGDWLCHKCQFKNQKYSQQCGKCKAMKKMTEYR